MTSASQVESSLLDSTQRAAQDVPSFNLTFRLDNRGVLNPKPLNSLHDSSARVSSTVETLSSTIMLVTHALSLSLHSSPPPDLKPSSFPSSRSPLTDSTNVNLRTGFGGSGCSRRFVYPTSATRTACGWSDVEPSTGANANSFYSRHHPLSSTPSPFPVTYKAPPTVSVSLSAACSQSIPGVRVSGPGPDLPAVQSAVPFPSAPLHDDTDVEMLDGTWIPCPDSFSRSIGHTPRKRRSAHSSVSPLPGTLGKDGKQKRQRKSRRQVTELWWLGVVHRSILRGIEERQPAGELGSSIKSLARPRDLGFMDRVLAEKIHKRLADNGYGDGSLPGPFPRISSPSMSMPSLNLLAPSREILSMDPTPLTFPSELNSKENVPQTTTTLPSSGISHRAPLSIVSFPPVPPSASATHGRHSEIPQLPRQLLSRTTVPRRSPSPPARTGSVSTNTQALTLTVPQLVASLTLAYHERNGSRVRRRSYRSMDCEQNAGRSPPTVPCQVLRYGNGDAIQDKEIMHQLRALGARPSSVPERKSPLSRVAYAGG